MFIQKQRRIQARQDEVAHEYGEYLRGITKPEMVWPAWSELHTIKALILQDDTQPPVDQESFVARYLPVIKARVDETQIPKSGCIPSE